MEISCGVVGGLVGVCCRSGVGGVGDGLRVFGSDGGWWGMLGVGTGGLGGGWDDLVWMVRGGAAVKDPRRCTAGIIRKMLCWAVLECV